MNQGERGPKGDHGQHGEVGDTGIQGERGGTGGYGERGDQGQRGDVGQSGERGPLGDRGLTGVQGERGREGVRGVEGERAEFPNHFVGWLLVAVVALSAALVLVPYSAAKKIRDTQVQACEAAKVDRALQAQSWHAAFRARKSTAQATEDSNERKVALAAAKVYHRTANRLEQRSGDQYVCADQYPEPPLLPF